MPQKNNDSDVQTILSQTQAILQKADEAITASQNFRAKLENELAVADAEYEKAQAAVDQDIKRVVQRMDDDTIQFVKDTE